MKNKVCKIVVAALWAVAISVQAVCAQEPGKGTRSVAVLPFVTEGTALQNAGHQISDLVNDALSHQEGITMVERDQLDKILSEMELGLSGTVSTQTAAKIGNLTGAKLIIFGRAFAVNNELYVTARLIGVETGTVIAETVHASLQTPFTSPAKELAERLAKLLTTKGDQMSPTVKPEVDPVEQLMPMVKDKKLPTIAVAVDEKHAGKPVLDPAAETEFGYIMGGLGFPMVDAATTTQPADIEIQGEALSEFGMRQGNLVSCKARVEVKVLEHATGKILAMDRQTETAVDISEQISGKTAIQKAASQIALRIVPKIVASIANEKVFVSK